VRHLLLGPLTEGSTYRRFVHLLLGAVVLLPYLGVGTLIVISVRDGGLDPLGAGLLGAIAVVVGIGVALVPGVRALEIAAARTLLDASVPEVPDRDSWAARGRATAWLALSVAAGAITALLALIVLPVAVGFVLAPWRPQTGLPTGLAAAWAPAVGLALPVVLLHAVAAAGGVLGRVAPRLLGPSTSERLVAELARARRDARELGHRTRLARELHDSVGHALTVTTLQAGAAARVLDSDPAFVARALEAIADAGRTALEELDHVLGLLRDGESADRFPQPDLGDLDALLDGARHAGVPVTAEVAGDPATVPAAVSREAYRILQEGLTNALRHAGPVPVAVRVRTRTDGVELEVVNPVGHGARVGGGRGITGMRERVAVLGGQLDAGPDADGWRVRARLPFPARMGA